MFKFGQIVCFYLACKRFGILRFWYHIFLFGLFMFWSIKVLVISGSDLTMHGTFSNFVRLCSVILPEPKDAEQINQKQRQQNQH